MSNHYHTVLYIDQARAATWSEEAVVSRWTRFFSCPPLVEQYLNGSGTFAEHDEVRRIIQRWRQRLAVVIPERSGIGIDIGVIAIISPPRGAS